MISVNLKLKHLRAVLIKDYFKNLSECLMNLKLIQQSFAVEERHQRFHILDYEM